MGSLGIWEIFLIFTVAFLVIGPANLPKVLRQVGKAMGEFTRVKSEVEESLYEVKDCVDDTVRLSARRISKKDTGISKANVSVDEQEESS